MDRDDDVSKLVEKLANEKRHKEETEKRRREDLIARTTPIVKNIFDRIIKINKNAKIDDIVVPEIEGLSIKLDCYLNFGTSVKYIAESGTYESGKEKWNSEDGFIESYKHSLAIWIVSLDSYARQNKLLDTRRKKEFARADRERKEKYERGKKFEETAPKILKAPVLGCVWLFWAAIIFGIVLSIF